FVRKEMLERAEKEGTEAASLCVRLGDQLTLQQIDEESLRQILGVCGRMPEPAGERIERIPVSPAKTFHRILSDGRIARARRQHQTPVRGRKLATSGLCAVGLGHDSFIVPQL